MPEHRLPAEHRAQRDFILLDGSGSMINKWHPMMDAIEAYVDTLARNGTQSFLTLSVFSTDALGIDHCSVDIADWESLHENPAQSTWGGTPLYDAINHMARRLKDEDPIRCSITIVTDGRDNESQTSVVQARAIIEWLRAKGWSVTFIGCDWNNSRLAAQLGLPEAAAIGVSQARLTDAARNLATKRTRYAATGAPMHWTDEEKEQFGGYLSHG